MCLVACVCVFLLAQPSPAPAQPEAPPPPPLPPPNLEPLDAQSLFRLTSTAVAPPPSPPYANTAVGAREAGRGIFLQQELQAFLAQQQRILRRGEPVAVHATLQELALMAIETTMTDDALTARLGSKRHSWLSGMNPVAFRRACVAGAARSGRGSGSIVEELSRLLIANGDPDDDTALMTTFLTLQTLEAIATDDPTTDLDNGHALAICATGIVPRLVALLGSPSAEIGQGAASAVAALVENPQCAKMILGGGAVRALVKLAKYGSDTAQAHALAALQILALDRDAREAIMHAGGAVLADGLRRHRRGAGEHDTGVRTAAEGLSKGLEGSSEGSGGPKKAVELDARARSKLARQTRLAQSKLLHGHAGRGSASSGCGVPRVVAAGEGIATMLTATVPPESEARRARRSRGDVDISTVA